MMDLTDSSPHMDQFDHTSSRDDLLAPDDGLLNDNSAHDGFSPRGAHHVSNGKKWTSAVTKERIQHGVSRAINTTIDMQVLDESIFDTNTVEEVIKKKHWLSTFKSPKFWCKVVLVIAVLALLLVVNFFLPSGFWSKLFVFLQSLGPLAIIVYAGIMFVGTCISIPPTTLYIFGGFLLGFWWTLLVGHIAHLLGSSVSFVLGRYFIGKSVQKKFATNKFFRALEIAVHRSSLKISIMLRLCPILPICVVTYMLSVSGVKYWHFVVATGIFLIPEELVYIYLGSTASSFTKVISADEIDFSNTFKLGIMAVGVVLSIVMGLGISFLTKHQVDKVLREERRAKMESEKATTELSKMVMDRDLDDQDNSTDRGYAMVGADEEEAATPFGGQGLSLEEVKGLLGDSPV
ncbi:SNARE associated Golgi protein [Carpediemonas membranifera]|uniref:SNARE associated Golgi protein n=1 Tax=Carpediemonas membranifera TaxID=201153 RepID=A0A8J6B870_9EUKA|nr:SNARE associated Golgi protein [Carpediemonas membranifera]|eukprot:KAG9396259.1 SNARE associated Golgi protein [Carpediemonas membranifera]